jgi:hypothetical protein
VTTIEIGGKKYDLAMSLYAMEQIEEEFGDLKEAMGKFRGKGSSVKMVKKMFRIMGNAALHAKKQPEALTGKELDNLGLAGLNKVAQALRAVMDESLEAETVNGGLADDEEVDVYAEQMEEDQKNA